MAYISMSLHPNHMIKGLSCRQEARLQIISLLLSMVLTYTCATFKTTKNNKTLHQFCGSLYVSLIRGPLFSSRGMDGELLMGVVVGVRATVLARVWECRGNGRELKGWREDGFVLGNS